MRDVCLYLASVLAAFALLFAVVVLPSNSAELFPHVGAFGVPAGTVHQTYRVEPAEFSLSETPPS